MLALLKLSGDWAAFKGEKAENKVKPVEPKPEFVVPQKGSVILPEAITPKAEKAEEEPLKQLARPLKLRLPRKRLSNRVG